MESMKQENTEKRIDDRLIDKKVLKWNLCLNLSLWKISLQPLSIKNASMLVIKRLTIEDVKRFGIDKFHREFRSNSDSLTCGNCDTFISGLCYKHPFLFIRENTPSKRPYSAEDTLPEFLYLADSTIPKAGKGIFTRIALPNGVSFGPYSGFIWKTERARYSGYSWEIPKKDPSDPVHWVDAKNRLYSNWMRYVNCARNEEEQNMIGFVYCQNVYYYTYKKVNVNQELMVWYGNDYGRFLGIENVPESSDESDMFAPPKESLSPNSYDQRTETFHLDIEEMLSSLTPTQNDIS